MDATAASSSNPRGSGTSLSPGVPPALGRTRRSATAGDGSLGPVWISRGGAGRTSRAINDAAGAGGTVGGAGLHSLLAHRGQRPADGRDVLTADAAAVGLVEAVRQVDAPTTRSVVTALRTHDVVSAGLSSDYVGARPARQDRRPVAPTDCNVSVLGRTRSLIAQDVAQEIRFSGEIPLSRSTLRLASIQLLSGPPDPATALGSARPGLFSRLPTLAAPGCASWSVGKDRTLQPLRRMRGRGHALRRCRPATVPAEIESELSVRALPCAMAVAPCSLDRKRSRGRRGVPHVLRRARWCRLTADPRGRFTPRRPRGRRGDFHCLRRRRLLASGAVCHSAPPSELLRDDAVPSPPSSPRDRSNSSSSNFRSPSDSADDLEELISSSRSGASLSGTWYHMPHVPVFPHLGPLRQADEPCGDRHASGGPRPGADHHPASDCNGPGAGRYLSTTAARERGSATLLNAARERGTGHLAAPEPLWPLDCGASGAIGRSDDDSFALVACSRLSAAAARERGSATLLNTARERGGSHLAVPEPPRPSEHDGTGTMRPPSDLSGSDILPVGAIAVQAHGTPIYPLGPVATRSFDALVAFTAAASALQGSLGKHAARLRGAVRTGSAPPRDILPLPPVLVSDLDHRCDLPPPLRQVLLAYANVSIAALNSLGSCSASAPVLPASKVQRVALTNVVSKVANMWGRLMTLSDVDLEPAGAIWQLVSDPAVRPLNASLIDTPDVAAQCDPMPHLDEETRARILAPTGVFSSAPTRLLRCPGISGSERRQYIALVVVQLRAGKLALSSRILAGASVFGRVRAMGSVCARSGMARSSRRRLPGHHLRRTWCHPRVLPTKKWSQDSGCELASAMQNAGLISLSFRTTCSCTWVAHASAAQSYSRPA